jgi:hypothetical protein
MKHSYVERMLCPDDYDGIEYATVKDLCFAALEQFSPKRLKAQERRTSLVAVGAPRPEAQFCYELYRCLHEVTGGNCSIQCQFSYTVAGKLDFFLKGKQWGVEVLRNGDRVKAQCDRFRQDGKYGKWGIVTEHVLLDFRSTPPKKGRGTISLIYLLLSGICFRLLIVIY